MNPIPIQPIPTPPSQPSPGWFQKAAGQIGHAWSLLTKAVSGGKETLVSFKLLSRPEQREIQSYVSSLSDHRFAEGPLSNLRQKVRKLFQQLLRPTSPETIGELEKSVGAEMELAAELLHSSAPLSDQMLDHFGSKHKNLVHQARLASILQIPGLKVPMPCGLDTDAVEAFLKQKAPAVFEQWQSLAVLYDAYTGQNPFLEVPEAAAHLQAIQQGILNAFSDVPGIELPNEIEGLLSECVKKGNYLMVRSSGAEDTSHAANAGGNVSKAYVPPERGSLCRAMGEVVSSYFSYGSLQNRINAGINPFTEKLKIGLTTQELIGEKIGETRPDHIPVSLVLFTNEPLYVGEEKFRVMRISATYGHGNGVVGGTDVIPTDTYLVMQSESNPAKLYTLSDIQKKTARLGPVQTDEGVKLQRIKNPPELVTKPTLDDEMVARLFHWGIIGERCIDGNHGQGIPTDMEIVIKNGTIYPVQGRPIIRPELLPSYLDLRKVEQQKSPLGMISRAEMIVPGNGSVVIVREAKDILVADTLEEAERNFKKGTHKLVIVNTPEPANSHPVVNFSGLGIPCLYFADKASLKKQLQAIGDEHPCLVCMQNATINSWDATTISPEECISKGFAVHPAKIAITLPVAAVPQKLAKSHQEVPQEVKNLLMKIRGATTNRVALDFLQALRSHEWVTKLETIPKALQERAVKMKHFPKEALVYLSAIDKLAGRVNVAFEELQGALQKSEGDRLRPLLHAKVLETLLTQRTAPLGTGVAHYSIVDVEPLTQAISDVITYQEKLKHPARLADLVSVGREALPPENREVWEKFLLSLEPFIKSKHISGKVVAEFKQHIESLRETGALASWMTLFFLQDIRNMDPKEALGQILNNNQSMQKVMQDLRVHHENIQQLRSQINLFDDPTTFDSAWNNLKQLTLSFTDKQLAPIIQAGSKPTNVALYKTMENLVDLFDTSIKAMKASQKYTTEEKLSRFHEMLGPYDILMADWARNLVPKGSIPQKYGLDLERYLYKIWYSRYNLSTSSSDKNLYPSGGFSVTAAAMGSAANFERHLPRTLEDLFTLIHQNLLFMISALNNTMITNDVISHSLLPPVVQKAIVTMDKYKRAGRIGISVDSDGDVVIRYNIPLQNHSGTIELRYHRDTDRLSMKGSFFGESRERWKRSKLLIELLDAIGTLPLKEPIRVSDQEIIFSWDIKEVNSLDVALEEYDAIVNFTMIPSSEPVYLLTPFVNRCRERGVEDELINYYLQNPRHEYKSFYDKFLEQVLPLKTPQQIPLAAIVCSSQPSALLYNLIAEWAKNPDLPCKDFIARYRSEGKLNESDEAFVRCFLPGDNDDGHALILSLINLMTQFVGPNYSDYEFQALTLEAYLKSAENIEPLINMVKEGIKHQDENDRRWPSVMVQIINQGKGFEAAKSLIKKYPQGSEKTRGFLEALLRQRQES